MVIGKCEMPNTDISQENDHAMLNIKFKKKIEVQHFHTL
jgi:hypothetical protein